MNKELLLTVIIIHVITWLIYNLLLCINQFDTHSLFLLTIQSIFYHLKMYIWALSDNKLYYTSLLLL